MRHVPLLVRILLPFSDVRFEPGGLWLMLWRRRLGIRYSRAGRMNRIFAFGKRWDLPWRA
jgi:hypothetical protein